MRKKIGKRIGPVPIALVAVFALAAFLSAGLLLTALGHRQQWRNTGPGAVHRRRLVCPGRRRCEVVLY